MSIDLNTLFNLINFSFALRKNVKRLLGKFVKKSDCHCVGIHQIVEFFSGSGTLNQGVWSMIKLKAS